MSFLRDRVLRLCKRKERVKIRDIGCSDGVVAGHIEQVLGTGDRLICIDITVERLRRAKRNCHSADVVAGTYKPYLSRMIHLILPSCIT